MPKSRIVCCPSPDWHAVNDSRNLAPADWHVPTDGDWLILVDYLGGEGFAGGKMKEAGTAHWVSPNLGATNESRFSALPAGFRTDRGYFGWVRYGAYFWSATASDDAKARSRELGFNYANALAFDEAKGGGFSVRCVR